jgi:histidinol dehydrogenase
MKSISVQELSPAGLRALGPTAVALAQLEGLDGHASAVIRRLKVLGETVDAAIPSSLSAEVLS